MKKPFTPLKNVYLSLYEGDKLSAFKEFANKTKIKKINKDLDSYGTSLKGYVKTTFDNIVSKLGEPKHNDPGDKVLVYWVVQFEDGLIVTIYIYRMTYVPKEEYPWHVGGPSEFSFRQPQKWKEIVNKMVEGSITPPESVTKDMLDNATRHNNWSEIPRALQTAIKYNSERVDEEEILQRVSLILAAPTSSDYQQL